MTQLPHDRQQQIVQWLLESKSLSIDQLTSHFGVSAMTIHRDLDQLARAGQIEKVHGGVRLPEQTPLRQSGCGLCSMDVPERTQFVIQLNSSAQVYACCCHCGLLLLGQYVDAASVLAREFLYGRMVNARKAVYLLESDVQLCCAPGVLCFASLEDAQRFQRGFRGRILGFDEAQLTLAEGHA